MSCSGAAGLQDDSCARELDRREANGCAGVDQHQVVDRHELAGDGAQRTGLLKVGAGAIALTYSAEPQDLFVQANDCGCRALELLAECRHQRP